MTETTIAKLIGENGNLRTRTGAADLFSDFITRLNLPPKESWQSDDKEKAIRFLVDVVLNIHWYKKKITHARRWRNVWIGASALMIVGIPLLLGRVSLAVDGNFEKQAPLIVAQLSGAITGVMGLQRFITAAMSAQQRFGAWWKASSDLNKLWFGLVTTWSHKDLRDNWKTDGEAFLKDLEDRTTQGRVVVSDEQADFFQKLALPSVDVLDTINKARTDVGNLITGSVPGAASAASVATTVASHASDVLKARQDRAKNDALVQSYDTDIAAKQAAIAGMADGDPLLAPAKQALAALQTARDAADLARRQADATLVSLQAG